MDMQSSPVEQGGKESTDIPPQGLGSGRGCRYVDDGVPEAEERQAEGGGEVETEQRLRRLEETVDAIGAGRDLGERD